MKAFIFLCVIFISYTYAYVDESVLNSLQTIEHWNTFRIVISHTDDECFYIDAQLNDTVHVIYQVVKGGDFAIRATITDPDKNIVFSQEDAPFGWYDEEHANVSGAYKICFRNQQYFARKILYIGVLAVHIDRLMESTVKRIRGDVNVTAKIDEFSQRALKTLNHISGTLYQMTAHLTIAHVQHVHDMYAIEANASYVQKWAICQIIVMILCSIIQVFSIRRLFKTSKPTKTIHR